MILKTKLFTLTALAAVAAPLALIGVGRGSDHADTQEIFQSPGADLTDVYMFPSTSNPNHIVLVMNVHPLIGPGQGPNVSFDPNVLYQFKVDNTGDGVEDLVVQARFVGQGPRQRFMVVGPTKPHTIGALNQVEHGFTLSGQINRISSDPSGMKVFCGAREDPFFFDLEQFFNIFPDRATPISGTAVSDPNTPQASGFRPAGQAVDFLSNGGYNVLSIVVEMPKNWLRGTNGSVVSMWETTNVKDGNAYKQFDRLARPAVNEVFATVANGRHAANDADQPTDDKNSLANDIQGFMTYPAGRSQAITDVVKAVLVPDVMKVDLDGRGAAYLGYETGGATGGTFGGRALSDDVVDISLGVIFGPVVPDLGLAPDDGNELPSFESDNVGDGGKHFLSTFPYLGNPR